MLHRDEILALQDVIRRVPVADHVFHYAAHLVRATRPGEPEAPEFVREWLSYGAGPRASIFLILAGKARAMLRGRHWVAVEDVQAVALPILRHRIVPNFTALSEGIDSTKVVEKLLETIPADERIHDLVGRAG